MLERGTDEWGDHDRDDVDSLEPDGQTELGVALDLILDALVRNRVRSAEPEAEQDARARRDGIALPGAEASA